MAEQVKKKKKRRKKHYFLRFLVIIALLVGVYFALNSALFYVADFEITGNVHFTDSMITEMTGIRTGKNLFFETDLRTARYNLLRSPYVKTAKISRKLPGTIVIEIEEREEFAAVEHGGKNIILDRDGLILRTSENEAYLPVISGLTIISAEEGKALETEQSYLLTKGLSLLKEAEVIDFYFERVEMSVSSVKAYIYYDQYYCDGTLDNIISSLSSIKTMVASQYRENITHGVIYVGSGGYLSYAP
jgi:cell division protein FtsQ